MDHSVEHMAKSFLYLKFCIIHLFKLTHYKKIELRLEFLIYEIIQKLTSGHPDTGTENLIFSTKNALKMCVLVHLVLN